MTATALNGGVTVSWVQPATGGAAITGYVITPFIAGTALAAVNVGGNPSSYTIWGLTNGTSYTYTVAALNADGTGPVSVPSAAVVPSGLPAVPVAPSAVAGSASATVTWTAPSGEREPDRRVRSDAVGELGPADANHVQ